MPSETQLSTKIELDLSSGYIPRRRIWQVSIRTLFLLITFAAVWITVYINRLQIKILESRNDTLRALARELIVKAPTKIAVVKRQEKWNDENEWQISLPEGKYCLGLATRDVDEFGLSTAVRNANLTAGIHTVALETEKDEAHWHVKVLLDGTEILASDEPLDWDPATGSIGGGDFSNSSQLPADKPVVLYRKRFYLPRDATGQGPEPNGPGNGILLWIEPTRD